MDSVSGWKSLWLNSVSDQALLVPWREEGPLGISLGPDRSVLGHFSRGKTKIALFPLPRVSSARRQVALETSGRVARTRRIQRAQAVNTFTKILVTGLASLPQRCWCFGLSPLWGVT